MNEKFNLNSMRGRRMQFREYDKSLMFAMFCQMFAKYVIQLNICIALEIVVDQSY